MNAVTVAVTEATTAPTLDEVRKQFEVWRETKSRPNNPIPDELWEAAVSLAGPHTLAVIAKALRLDPKALAEKARVTARSRDLSCRVNRGAVLGYDLEVRVGLDRHVRHRQRSEIQRDLETGSGIRILNRPDYVRILCGSLEQFPAAFAALDQQEHDRRLAATTTISLIGGAGWHRNALLVTSTRGPSDHPSDWPTTADRGGGQEPSATLCCRANRSGDDTIQPSFDAIAKM